MNKLKSPLFYALALALTVFISAWIIMSFVLGQLNLSKTVENLLGALLVTLFTVPTLNYLLYKPLQKQNILHKKNLDKILILSTITEQSPISIMITDARGVIEYVNPKFCNLTGYTLKEVIGKNPRFLNSGYTSYIEYKDLWKAITNRKQWTGLFHNRKKNGELYWEASLISPVFDANGNTTHYLALKEDVTQTKKRDELLEKKNEELLRLSIAVEKSPVSIVITDANANIEYVNPKFTETSGYSSEEAIGQNPRIMKAGDAYNETYTDLWETIISGKIWNGELHNKKKNGELYWESVKIAPILDPKKQITHFVAIKEDITQVKAQQQKLIKVYKQALRANKAKTEFLANMSHELRTPLHGVIGSASLLQDISMTAEQKKYIDAIESSAKYLLYLINDILDLSKIETQQITLENEIFSIHDVIEETLQVISVQQGVTLNSKIKDIPDLLQGDRIRLKQILVNLLGNASKFTNKGEILLSIKKFKHGNCNKYINAEFIISDSGIGMNQKTRSSIFNSFTQADSSISKKYGGSGLGLTITKTIIQKMKGRIKVFSKKGKGTTFIFIIKLVVPQKKTPATNENTTQKKKCDPSKFNILIVDDNKVNVMILEAMVKRKGFNTILARSGVEAIEVLKKSKIDICLMDIQMPEMDGITATKIIRNEMKLKLPIIAVTAGVFISDRKKALRSGMDGFLSKPVDFQKLIETLFYFGASIKK